MLKFQNFGRHPGQSRLPAPFSPAVGQNSKFRSQHFVCLVVPIPKRCNTTPLPQNPWRQKPTFLGPWSPRHPPKNYLQGVKWALKILRQSVQGFKSYGTFSKWHIDTQTDGWTDKNKSPQYHYIIFFLHICEGEGGKLYKLYLFTLWRIISSMNLFFEKN